MESPFKSTNFFYQFLNTTANDAKGRNQSQLYVFNHRYSCFEFASVAITSYVLKYLSSTCFIVTPSRTFYRGKNQPKGF
jgi:hypothetical protein